MLKRPGQYILMPWAFTRRRAHMRWSNSGKDLCEENKIADTVYSNKSQKSTTGG
jgi:hypothetical protein